MNPYNVLDIRRGIIRVMTDAAYRDQLVNNGWKLRYRYSISNITEQYTDVYKELATAAAPEFFLLRQAKAAASLLGIV